MKEITGKQLKKWAEWLKENGCGCCHLELIKDDKGNIYSIAMGWLDGYDESDKGKWQSGTWKICTEIGYQPENSFMQTDLGIDFLMPYDGTTGEVDDTCLSLPENPDWDRLADYLNEEAARVVSQWAYFEETEEEAA